MKNKSKRSIFVVLMVIVVGIGLLGFNGFSQLATTNTAANKAGDAARTGFTPPSVNMFGQIAAATNPNTTVPCIDPTLPVPDQYHIHPHLTVTINGQNITIPANIGLTEPPCEREVHTHDNTGTIHVEPNVYYPFTLGDFFNVWGEPFSPSGVFNYAVDSNHKLTMTVDGAPSNDFQNLLLKDQQQITIDYEPTASSSSTPQ